MASPTNHWKLGLFVVGSVVLSLTALVVLGARNLQKESVGYKTFFDESVQGLDVGSSVKFRGVTIGNVSAIDIAPDRRRVEVTSDLVIQEISRLGLAVGKGGNAHIRVPSDLRMQLASAGITGVKFLQIDFFPESDNPPPELPFPAPDNYIPAAVSTMKNIEDSIVRAVNRIPEVSDQALLVMKQLSALLEDVEDHAIPEKTSRALVKGNDVLRGLETVLEGLEPGKLSEQAQATLGNLNATITKLNHLVDRISADDGFYASAQRASDAVGDVARHASGLGIEVDQTLRTMQEAASSIQRLTDALERDSDMLVKGRTRRSR